MTKQPTFYHPGDNNDEPITIGDSVYIKRFDQPRIEAIAYAILPDGVRFGLEDGRIAHFNQEEINEYCQNIPIFTRIKANL